MVEKSYEERMKCPQCSRQLVGIEYAYNHPDHYDGVSEWACPPCGYRLGRWSGILLGEGETEKPYGRRINGPAD
ncbi:unnamed protein product [marine sediment metagenome]|uniref:Uncharacterized protein n=1 Tax=marine sediment metagenome TaxID=412755 RepID=X0Z150_9ZZZZ